MARLFRPHRSFHEEKERCVYYPACKECIYWQISAKGVTDSAECSSNGRARDCRGAWISLGYGFESHRSDANTFFVLRSGGIKQDTYPAFHLYIIVFCIV